MKQLHIFFSLFLFSCASVQTLTGGDKDTTPPKVISTSTDSGTLHVATNQFTFVFDENITTTNVNELLLISPTQVKNPTVEVKGSILKLTLNDTLIPNTTYTIKFNGCILDLNESNPIGDYSYLFSTGAYLDSTSVQGYVRNITTNQPCINCNIQLYTEQSDSVVLKRKPDYISKTNAQGFYNLTNLPNKIFKAVALLDENKNLLLDNKEFISLPLLINTTHTNPDTIVVFPFFQHINYQASLVKTQEPGIIKIALNKPLIYPALLSLNDTSTNYKLTPLKDTIICHILPYRDTTFIFLQLDTTKFYFTHIFSANNLLRTPDIDYYSNNGNTLVLKSSTRISTLNQKAFKLTHTNSIIAIQNIRHEDNLIFLQFNSIDLPSQVEVLEDGITDIYGNKNSLISKNMTLARNLNSNLKINLAVDTTSYILQIFKGTNLYKTEFLNKPKQLVFSNLPQGTYFCKLITDLNNNQLWDTGNYFLGIKPEPIQFTEAFDMRENWDKDLIIKSL